MPKSIPATELKAASSPLLDDFFLAEIRNVPADCAEELSALSFEHSATGISENLQFNQPDLNFDPQTTRISQLHWSVYFKESPSQLFQEKVLALHPAVSIKITKESGQDWMEEWKKSWKAFELAGAYWIVPSWLKSPTTAKWSIRIDPGMAFGTGTHATTQMAAELLVQCFEEEAPESVLDVGTGTGILAILAGKLGAQQLDATDIDPEARRVARENFDLNKIGNAIVFENQVEELKESYDLVIANIIDGVLLKLRQQLKARLKPGGILILSGILLERELAFFEQFDLEEFEVLHRLQSDEWVAYSVRHRLGS